MKLYLLIAIIFLMFFSPLEAHGDLDLRIEEVSQLIKSYPDSAELYFKRGKLKFQHEEYEASIKDINQSVKKGYTHDLQNIYLAKSFFKLENYEVSIDKLNTFLEDDPNNVVGLNLKGRILYAQEKYESSAQCFEQVIQLSIRSLPENYLEAAKSWSASSNKDKYYKTINILELGIENLGPIVTIQDKLIETHLENNHGEKAIATQLSIIESKKRKESALYKLAEIYLQLDQPQLAKTTAESAKEHLEKLPLRIQHNSAMKLLKTKIQQLITNY